MSTAAGPNIATSGLVLDFDMSNTQKSWKGAPTTNLITNPNSAINVNSSDVPSGLNITGYASYSSGYDVAYWSPTSTAATGVTFSYSVYMRSPGGISTYLMYVYTGTGSDGGWNYAGAGTLTSNWERYTYTTGGWTGTVTNLCVYRYNQLGTIEIAAPQFEVQSFATPFVIGTRSGTQTIIDLTNKNTLTASSLTYAANNTFSFNGTSNSITVPFNATNFTFNSEQTIIIWMKNQSPSSARRNPYNQAYAGGGTITHENDGAFNYYYGTGGGDNSPYTGYTSPFSVTVGETAMICITRNTAQTAWYKNGVLGSTTSNPFGVVLTGTSNITIGSGYAGSFGGNIYTVQLYNRALSATEVAQNFNASRSRYGL